MYEAGDYQCPLHCKQCVGDTSLTLRHSVSRAHLQTTQYTVLFVVGWVVGQMPLDAQTPLLWANLYLCNVP